MTFRLESSGVLDVAHALRVLKLHSLPGQEEIDDTAAQVHRVLRLNHHLVEVRLTLEPTGIVIEHDAPDSSIPELRATADHWFGLSQDSAIDYASLQPLPTFARLSQTSGHLRLISYPSVFEALATTVIGQQVSLAAARTLAGRYVENLGELHPSGLRVFPTAHDTAAVEPVQIQSMIRCPLARATTLHTVATWYQQIGQHLVDDRQQFLTQLISLRGVGPWTRDYMALRGLREPTIFLDSDLVIRRALSALGTSEDELRNLPLEARYLATILLWNHDSQHGV